MDMDVLKKKISTYKGPGGRVRITSDDLLMEILKAWEEWTGPAKGFYSSLGVSSKGFASVIGKAKKLKREGRFPVEEFTEVKLEGSDAEPSKSPSFCKDPIVLKWDKKRIIRFSRVDQLIEFLDKSESKAS
jgi:hypothetical protein